MYKGECVCFCECECVYACMCMCMYIYDLARRIPVELPRCLSVFSTRNSDWVHLLCLPVCFWYSCQSNVGLHNFIYFIVMQAKHIIYSSLPMSIILAF